jgi:hypothetical protein
MLAKLRRRLGTLDESPLAARTRHWTTGAFGRSVLAAESRCLAAILPESERQRVIELATIETPPSQLAVVAMFAAAQQSWREPVIASLQVLPLLARSVESVVWRFLALDGVARAWLLRDIERVLAPGGVLVTCHLNPVYSACWTHTAMLNLGLQSASAVIPAASLAGLQLQHSEYAGPGWWRYRPLRVCMFRKPLAQRVHRSAAVPRLGRQPATAALSNGGLSHTAGPV